MGLLAQIANPYVADVAGGIQRGQTHKATMRQADLNAQVTEEGLASARRPKPRTPKEQLEDFNARATLQFKMASTLLSQKDPAARAEAAAGFNLPEGTDLSDETLSTLQNEAAYGMDLGDETGKVLESAAVMRARGDEAGARAIEETHAKKYGNKDAKVGRKELFDRKTNESFWVDEINGDYYRGGKRLTNEELDKYTEKGISRSETAAPGGFSKDEAKEFREYEITTESVLGLTKRIREQAVEGGAGIMGFVGSAQSIASGVAAQVTAGAKALGGEAKVGDKVVSEDKLRDASLYAAEIESSFGKAGAKNAAFKSNLIDLAYVLARAKDPGGRLSDKDVKFQLERLASHGDPNQLGAVLDEIEMDLSRNFDIRADKFEPTKKGKYTPKKVAASELQGLKDKLLNK